MKKLTSLTLSLLAFATFSYGQLEIIYPTDSSDRNVLNDSTIKYYGSVAASGITSTLNVVNTGAIGINVNVYRYYVSMLAGTTNSICWAGTCYAVTADTSQSSYDIGAHDTAELGNQFNGDYYYPDHQVGTTSIGYVFYNVSNPADRDSIIIQYITTTEAVQQLTNAQIAFSAYPNPANGFVNFSYNFSANISSANLKLFNVIGECVQTIPLNTGVQHTTLNTQNLPSGVYIGEIEAAGFQPAFQKLVVSH